MVTPYESAFAAGDKARILAMMRKIASEGAHSLMAWSEHQNREAIEDIDRAFSVLTIFIDELDENFDAVTERKNYDQTE